MTFKYNEFKRIRKEKRWSLGILGEAVGMSRRALTNWENGHSEPKESNIKKLATFLEVPVSMISDLQDTIPVSEKKIEDSAAEFMSFYKEETENRRKVEEVIRGVRVLENKLSESSLVINAIITSIKVPIYIKDINQNYVLANHAFIESLGLHKSYKVAGKTDEDLFSSTEAAKNRKEDQDVLNSGNEIVNSEEFIPGSRRSKWGMISKFPIFDSENKVAGLFGLFYDITERTRTENLRKLMEAAFLKSSSNVLYIYNSKFKLIYLSDSFESVYGYSKEEHLNNPDLWINKCLHPDYKEQFLSYRHIKDWPSSLKYKCIDSNGQVKWIEANTHKFKFMNMECLACFERDISSQKSLAWKNVAMYEIINSLPDTIVWSGTFKNDGKVEFDILTENIKNITGYNRTDVMTGKVSFLSLFPNDKQFQVQNWFLEPKYELILEHGLCCADKSTVNVITKIFSVFNQENERTFFGMHTVK